jgi:acetylornithine deacetylase
LKALEELVCRLVAIESVNPDLVPGGAGERAIASFVASWLDSAGCSVSILEPVPGRPSVVGVVRGSGGGRSLMLNAHMDTVGSGGMDSPFSPSVHSGRVYGRGAYDMKASLAAIMLAARSCLSLRLPGDLIVCAVADEEVASLGTSAVLKEFHADFGIVTEPTECSLCLAHKGFVWMDVETFGVAAHGSRADLGVDAIAHMGRVLTGVLALDSRLRTGRRHPLLGTGSLHASLIQGGTEMSTYPDRCVARLERRTIPGEDGASCVREIKELLGDELGSVNATLERPPSEVPAQHPVSAAVSSAAGAPGVVGVAYWMDMALMNAAGIPTVAYGPIGEGEHADVEWVDIAAAEKCVEVYVRTAELLCS